MKPIKLILTGLLTICLILFLLYLLLPSQGVQALPDSFKSTEPGDTVQIPGVSAYYSQLDRKFVTKYYQDQFSPQFFGIKVPTYRINHQVEFAREKFRSGIQSSYLEEVVVPFRESLFINGWEPEVYLSGEAVNKEIMVVEGTKYFSKTTLRPFYASIPAKIANFFGIIISALITYRLLRRIIVEKKQYG